MPIECLLFRHLAANDYRQHYAADGGDGQLSRIPRRASVWANEEMKLAPSCCTRR